MQPHKISNVRPRFFDQDICPILATSVTKKKRLESSRSHFMACSYNVYNVFDYLLSASHFSCPKRGNGLIENLESSGN